MMEIFHYNHKRHWDKIAYTYLKAHNPILDAGCGAGRFIEQYPQAIIGIDWNAESVQQCKRKGYNVTQADIRDLPFEDSSIAGIHCSHVIEHFLPSDVYKILSEFDRVLKPQGILVIRSPILWWGIYSDLTHMRPYNPNAIIHYFTPSQERTLQHINTSYRVLHRKWRYASVRTRLSWCDSVLSISNCWGFPWLKKTGYMLVMKKGSVKTSGKAMRA